MDIISFQEDYRSNILGRFCDFLRNCCDGGEKVFFLGTKLTLKNDNLCRGKWKTLYDNARAKEKILRNIYITILGNFESREVIVPLSILTPLLESLQTIIKKLRQLIKGGTHISGNYPTKLPDEFNSFSYVDKCNRFAANFKEHFKRLSEKDQKRMNEWVIMYNSLE